MPIFFILLFKSWFEYLFEFWSKNYISEERERYDIMPISDPIISFHWYFEDSLALALKMLHSSLKSTY